MYFDGLDSVGLLHTVSQYRDVTFLQTQISELLGFNMFNSLRRVQNTSLLRNSQKPQDIAMSSFILPRVSRRISKRRKNTAANNNQLSAVCQTSFPIPDTDTVANWPSLFHLNQLMDVLALEKGTFQAQKCNTGDSVEQLRSMLLFCLPGSNYSKPA